MLKQTSAQEQGIDPVSASYSMLAPHGKEIVEVATFPASSVFTDDDCPAFARRAAAARAAELRRDAPAQAAPPTVQAEPQPSAGAADGDSLAPSASDEERDGFNPDGWELPLSCEHQAWTYRTAKASGKLPGPITVTLGGTVDEKPVKPATWKLLFDPKAFRYTVPKDLGFEGAR